MRDSGKACFSDALLMSLVSLFSSVPVGVLRNNHCGSLSKYCCYHFGTSTIATASDPLLLIFLNYMSDPAPGCFFIAQNMISYRSSTVPCFPSLVATSPIMAGRHGSFIVAIYMGPLSVSQGLSDQMEMELLWQASGEVINVLPSTIFGLSAERPHIWSSLGTV